MMKRSYMKQSCTYSIRMAGKLASRAWTRCARSSVWLAMFPLVLSGQVKETPPSEVKEIIVICKTHFDIGYTHRVSEVVDYYRTDMIDRALKAMDASAGLPKEQQFAWTIPGWVLSKTMEEWDGQSPERKKKLDEQFRSRHLISHALPFTIISDISGTEEMARGLIFSSVLNRKYGFALSRSGKMTDEPSHSGALATVLAHAGIKFLHIGCNWPSGFVKTPGLFWWEGPDGGRVLTLYSPSYGTNCAVSPKSWRGPNDPMMGENLLPAKDWPYKVWPAILVTGDNSGPPTAARIQALFDEVKEKMPGVRVRMGTMDDFYDAVVKDSPDIPVVRSAMPDTWIHGVMCDPGGIRLLRETRSLIASAEVLGTQMDIWRINVTDAAPKIAKVYENILLYDEHTWGGSRSINKYGKEFEDLSAASYKGLESSWEDKTGYIREASQTTRALLATNMEQLTKQVQSRKPAVLVYNSLPWKRSGWIETEEGRQYVQNIPACGYRVVPTDDTGKPQKEVLPGHSIENEYFKLVFDTERGVVASLTDKRTGREWIDKNTGVGFGQYLNERFTFEQTLNYTMAYQQGRAKDWPHPGMHKPGMVSEKVMPYRAASPRNGKLKITREGTRQTAEVAMPADRANHLPASSLRISLYKGQPFIDLEITIEGKEKDNWPEADWLCLPFRIDRPEFDVYRQLGVMNPTTDIQPGANRHLYAAEYGVAITGEDGAGFAVCPIDHPLVSLGEPGCWKYSEDYVPEKPVIYLNLYNNQWNTNFRYWYPGTWSSRIRLWTINKGTAREKRTQQFMVRAMEARNPLQVKTVKKQDGNLPAACAGVSVSRPGVLVTAFGADPDGNAGTLLRVWEQAGVSGKLTVTLPKGMKVSSAQPVNLRGETNGEAIPVKSGKFQIELGKYAPASFVLR